jgi:thioredoxin reductase (NADPH)
MNPVFDCIILGGGPAGLSAAIYLARYRRTALVVDAWNGGRWNTHEINENFLGFPDGIPTKELRERSLRQALRFGAEYVEEFAHDVQRADTVFEVGLATRVVKGRTLLIATGVLDVYPTVPDRDEYLGRSLFWCITCDGPKSAGKRMTLLGQTDDAVCTLFQFLNYTDRVALATNCAPGLHTISPVWMRRIQRRGIPFHEGIVERIEGTDGRASAVHLENGMRIPTDVLFSHRGSAPRSELAKKLGVKTDRKGFILLKDNQQRTHVPGVYAAGDVTKEYAHQVVSAAHEGATAGMAINYDLYEDYQKLTTG